MTRNVICILFVFLLLFFTCKSEALCGLQGKPAVLLKNADQCRKSLYYSIKKQKYRHNWLKCIHRYKEIYTRYPKTDQAAWALYQSARLLTGLYTYSGRSKYLDEAVDLYRRLVDRYKNHCLADDAQYRIGEIFYKHKKDLSKAYEEFLKVSTRFPSGDMRPKAIKKVKKLSSELGKKIKLSCKRHNTAQKVKLIAVKDIRHWSAPDYTRVVVDLDHPVKYGHHLLKADFKRKKPPRLYLDLENTRISAQINRVIPIKGDLLQRARAAQYTKDTVRVVLDMERIGEYKIFHLHDPFRIVVDVRRFKGGGEKDRPKTDLKKRAAIKASNAPQPGLSIQTIVIDPAHGGKDPGCNGLGGVKEKNIALSIAKLLARKIEKKIGWAVLLTRDRDIFLPLEQRTAFANMKKADLFLSLHVNANSNRKVRGLETFFLNVSTDVASMMVAARENASSEKNLSDLQSILRDLMLNSNVHESSRLANVVHKEMVSLVSRKYKQVKDLGVKQAPFYVLIGAHMPAILVQTGFLSNPMEKKRLFSKKYQECLAEGICAGIVAYIKNTGGA